MKQVVFTIAAAVFFSVLISHATAHTSLSGSEAVASAGVDAAVASGSPLSEKVQSAFLALRKKAASAKKGLKWKRKKNPASTADVLANLEKLHKEKADSLEKFCKPFADWVQIGEGQFGKVYKVPVVKQEGNFKDKPFVAVKVLLTARLAAADPETKIRNQVSFLSEIMANAFILKEGGHPNIASSLGIFNAKVEGQDSPVLVVEFLEGYSPLPVFFTPRGLLDEALKGNADLDETAVAALRAAADDSKPRFVRDWSGILTDILSAVAWMNTKNIFHNDLHGGNILMKEISEGKYSVKVIDNGLVTAADKSDAAKFGIVLKQSVLSPLVVTTCAGDEIGHPHTDAFAIAVLSESTAGFASLGTTFWSQPLSLLQTGQKLWRRIHKNKRHRVHLPTMPSSLRGPAFDYQMTMNQMLNKDKPTEIVSDALKEALSPEQGKVIAEALSVANCGNTARTSVTVVEIAKKFGIAPKKTFTGQVKKFVANLKLFKPGSPSAQRENAGTSDYANVEKPVAEYKIGDAKQDQNNRDIVLSQSIPMFNPRAPQVISLLSGPDQYQIPNSEVADSPVPSDPVAE